MLSPATATNRSWLIVALLFFYTVINFFDKLVMGLSAVPIMKDLQIGPKEYGLIGSSFFLLYAVSGILFGLFVVNRMGSRWLLALLAIIWSLAQLPIALTSSLTMIIVCRVLLGVGEGPGTPAAYHACFSWFPSDRRNLPTAIMLQGATLGFILGAPLLTFLIVDYGWRSAFFFCSLLGIVWAVLWLVLGEDGPHHARPTSDGAAESGRDVSVRLFWFDPTMIGILVAGFAGYWSVGLFVAWLPPYLQLGLGFDQKSVGWIISGSNVLQIAIVMLASLASQWIMTATGSSRIGRGLVTGGCLAAGGVCLIAGMLIVSIPVKILLVSAGLMLPIVNFVLGPAIVGEIAPSRMRGPALLVTFSVVTISGVFSPILTGRLVEAAGARSSAGYATSFEITGAILIVGGVVGMLLLDPEATRRRFSRLSAVKDAGLSPAPAVAN